MIGGHGTELLRVIRGQFPQIRQLVVEPEKGHILILGINTVLRLFLIQIYYFVKCLCVHCQSKCQKDHLVFGRVFTSREAAGHGLV